MLEHRDPKLNAGDKQFLGKLWPNTRGDKFTKHLAVVTNAAFAEHENVLHGDDVAFHAGNFSERDHFARTITEAADLDDHVNRGSDLPAQGALGNVQAAHGDHGFEAAQRVAWRVGVNRGERTVMASVHG